MWRLFPVLASTLLLCGCAVIGLVPSQFHVSTHRFLLPDSIEGRVTLAYEFMCYPWQDPLEIEIVSDGKGTANCSDAEMPPIHFYLNGKFIGASDFSGKDVYEFFKHYCSPSFSESGEQCLSFSLDEKQLQYLKENQLGLVCRKNFPWDYWRWVLTPFYFHDKISPEFVDSQ